MVDDSDFTAPCDCGGWLHFVNGVAVTHDGRNHPTPSTTLAGAFDTYDQLFDFLTVAAHANGADLPTETFFDDEWEPESYAQFAASMARTLIQSGWVKTRPGEAYPGVVFAEPEWAVRASPDAEPRTFPTEDEAREYAGLARRTSSPDAKVVMRASTGWEPAPERKDHR
ncbi:hypothetical protein [Agromyces humi]|uniref:hypothetical protein n=1 Tax=Agromyces humi TaxID=1766800 RepID=UPI00135C34E7|nr:hypothetical protein [Agromyces humi]